jgi:two-component system, cell cycle response regulator
MPRILLVEDNEVNRTMLSRRLQQKGYEVVGVESGEQCLELATASPPDLILMDIGLPGIDGWETTRRLRTTTVTSGIPVIGLSAHAQATDREKSLAVGCVEFETKPVHLPALLEKIVAALGARQAADETSIFDANPPQDVPGGTAVLRVADTVRPTKTVCPIGRKRILVVEDTDANRVTALELARRETFDLMLLDIMMPELDGYQVLGELKADPNTAALPVIMISALDEMASVVRCIEAGAEDYLTKPYDPVLLQARINACLDKRRLRDQEMAYLRAVSDLTTAAAAVELGRFDPAELTTVSAREDELGRLARVFQRMAVEVQTREKQLRQEVARLKVEIDDVRKREQVAEITETSYFQDLQHKAAQLRRRFRKPPDGGPTA